jgi:Tfp pilus assembly major pilin PilA
MYGWEDDQAFKNTIKTEKLKNWKKNRKNKNKTKKRNASSKLKQVIEIKTRFSSKVKTHFIEMIHFSSK